MSDRIVSLTGIVDRTIALSGIANGFVKTSYSLCSTGISYVQWIADTNIDNLYMRDQWTIEGWTNINGLSGAYSAFPFFKYKYGGGEYYGWQVSQYDIGGTTLYFEMALSASKWLSFQVKAAYVESEWFHYAFTYDYPSDTFAMYVNGVTQTHTDGSAYGAREASADDSALPLQVAHLENVALTGVHGWQRVSSNIRYNGNFTPFERIYTPIPDSNTLWLMNLEEGSGTRVWNYDGVSYGDLVDDTGSIGWCSYPVCIEGDGGIVWQPYSEINNLYMRDALTIEGWYRVDSWDVPASSDLYMFDKYNYSDPTYYGWQFYASPGVDSIDYMYFEMGFSYTSWIGASYTPSIANGDWYHIALTLNYTTSDLKIYLNGISQSLAISGAIAGRDSTADDSAEALHIANHGRNWTAGLDGRIGWSQIHNRIKYTENFTPPSRTIVPSTDSLTLFSMPLGEGAGITVSSADGNGTGTFTPGVGAIDWCP